VNTVVESSKTRPPTRKSVAKTAGPPPKTATPKTAPPKTAPPETAPPETATPATAPPETPPETAPPQTAALQTAPAQAPAPPAGGVDIPVPVIGVRQVHLRTPQLPHVELPSRQFAGLQRTVRDKLPEPEKLVYYGGLGALAAFGVMSWPVAAAIGAGVWVAGRVRSGSEGSVPEGSVLERSGPERSGS
jgi:hypothetical protein